MRVSIAQKYRSTCDNAVAMANAKTEQLRRLVETLQGANTCMTAELSRMVATKGALEAEHKSLMKQHEARAADIATLKAEILALTVANAEMRGYIARTLEDDTVREVGPTVEQPPQVHIQNVQPMPPRNVRTGPFPPPVWVGMDMAQDNDRLSRFAASRNTQVAPKPWHDR